MTAAYALFQRNPYPDVTVADIAAAAVVSRATFFRHFADMSDAIAGVERAFMNRSDFDPKTSRREFVVATNRYWTIAI